MHKLSSATIDGWYAINSEVVENAFWRIFVSNVLPGTVTNAVYFDRLPNVADGDDFLGHSLGPVNGATVAAQSADNEISAAATYSGSTIAFESNPAVVTIASAPGIGIVKTTNGLDAQTSDDAPVVPVRSNVHWSYVVTNIGNTTLTDVTVADHGGAFESDGEAVEVFAPDGFGRALAPGASATFTAYGPANRGSV